LTGNGDLLDLARVAGCEARINRREMDGNEKVQDRCSGRLPECGAGER